MSIFLLAICLLPASTPDIILIDHDIRTLESSDVLSELEVVYESSDWFMAIGEGDLIDLPETSILVSDFTELGDYSLVHLQIENDWESAQAVGEVLFYRDQIALVRNLQESGSFHSFPGVHLVQPLRIYSRSEQDPFRITQMENPLVTDIVAAVNEDTLKSTIQTLEDYGTRLCVTPQFLSSCEWIESKLLEFGLTADIELFTFTNGGTTYESYNVVAEKPGLIEPEVIIIICGHLDSITMSNPYVSAPGADDNASGSATVLEAARILSEYNFRYTLRFLFFGAEEVGLIGSDIYATEAAANGDSIIAVMNLDMILYAPESMETLFVPYNTISTDLANNMEAISALYVPELDLNVLYSPGTTYSDHASFWQQGYPALLGIEDGVNSNPYYHQETDLLANYLGYFPFPTLCVKASLATVAVYADPLAEGIEEGVQGEGFRIEHFGPVPATQNLTVQLAGFTGTGELKLFDLAGREAASVSLESESNSQATFDVSTLPAGVYGLRATSGQMYDTRMVLVTR